MLIKIQGLPIKTKYQDVKLLVRSECTIADFKLDNLVTDSDGKKKVLVTVGNEAEAFCLIKCLNGYRMSSNCVLSVETLTTPKPSDLNPSIQNSYEQRSASNYPQSRSDYSNQTVMDYNRGPHSYGPSGSHAMPQRPIEAMGGRSDGWNSGNGPGNQWGLTPAANLQGAQSSGFPGTPIYPQHPSIPQRVDSSAYTGSRPQQSSSYGYPTKNNISNAGNHLSSRHDMRSTDASLNHIATGRYPPSYQQEKPITIMKDNFQGPTTYQMGTSAYQAATHGTPQVWNQGQETKSQGYPKSHAYDDDRRHPQLDKRTDAKSSHDSMRVAMYKDYEKSRQFSPTRRILPGHGSPSMKKRASSPHAPSTREMLARRLGSPDRKISPMGVAMSGRLSPPLRNVSPPIRRASPPIRRVSPSGRWVSTRPISPGRRASPSARRPSPSGRRPSPSARRISPSGRRISPSARRISPSGRRISPSGRRISPSGRRISPSGRRISPSGRRISPPGRRISPSGRRNSPPGRRISPSGGRVMAPSMRVSPSGRRISPSSRRPPSLERRPSPSGRRISPSRMATRHMSPSGRRGSPSDRRMSPSDRRMLERRASPRRPSAQKRASPGRRVESPPGPASRQPARYSPRRHLDDKMVDPKMDMDPLKNKQVRPAYEIQASSQAMYSSGYRQNVKENISYPIPAARQPEQRLSPWHQDREKNAYPPMKKQDDDRRDVNEKRHPRSRSPVPRERSPVREHYRTTSPVSRSPRRSWALEKRPYGRSPETREVPPPPSWPGNKPRDEDAYKNKFSRSEDVLKHPLVWERPPMKIEDPKRIEEQRGTEDKLRGRGMPQRDMAPAPYDQNQREPKFNTRHEFEDSRKEEYQRQRDMMRRSPDRREFREAHPSGHDGRRHDEYRRAPSPRREEPKKTEFPQEFEKDFEDIYKRAQEFRKKAEQMRMSGDRRRDDREDHHESHRDDKYDSRRDRSPHRRSELDRYEPERHYDDPKYKEIDRSDREPEWKEQKPFERVKRFNLLPHVKAKRDKAAEDLLAKIMRRHKHITDLTEEQRKRVAEELRLALARVMMDMFDDSDVSFIEIVIKYEAKMGGKQEEAMVLDVLKCLPSMYRRGKRTAAEPEGSSKMERYSPETAIKEDRRSRWSPVKDKPQWETNPEQHRQFVDNRPKYEKYEHPKEQRPKFANKPRVEARPVERIIPKQKFEQHSVETRPKLRPKVIVGKPKLINPIKVKPKVEAKVSPKIKEHDEKPKKSVEEPKEIDQAGGPSDEPAAESSAPDGYYELSPLMSRMLDTELQDIMIKVWQELPDNPTSEAEKVVVNKLRNKAGDDLRNVFGLNVSQRLLNVFNMFHIRMRFTANPEGQELTRFLMKNNITNFKWSNIKPLIYHAVAKTVQDFHRLCTNETYDIGNVQVIITSLYQFTKCPPKLRTSYHIDNSASKTVTKNEASDENNSTTKTEAKPEERPAKPNETKSADTKPAQEKVVEKPPVVVKETAKPVADAKEKPKEVAKVQTSNSDKKNPQKPPVKKIEKKPIEKKELKKEPVKKIVDKKPKASCKNILQAGNDFDELDDDEIMALVSQGIILDQCSGSDED